MNSADKYVYIYVTLITSTSNQLL